MYEIYILRHNDWKLFTTTNNKNDLDKVVYKLIMLRPNKAILIEQDEKELVCLDGTEYQYWYFKNKFIREKKCDYIKTFTRKDKNE